MITLAQARKLMPHGTGATTLKVRSGEVDDIIQAIKNCDKHTGPMCHVLAKRLQVVNAAGKLQIRASLKALWDFVKKPSGLCKRPCRAGADTHACRHY